MKNPNNSAFSPALGDMVGGLTKKEYVYIELLKVLIMSGNKLSSEQLTGVMETARLMADKIFEK